MVLDKDAVLTRKFVRDPVTALLVGYKYYRSKTGHYRIPHKFS